MNISWLFHIACLLPTIRKCLYKYLAGRGGSDDLLRTSGGISILSCEQFLGLILLRRNAVGASTSGRMYCLLQFPVCKTSLNVV